jgi:tetratricopeptide (TPR) repeat protein
VWWQWIFPFAVVVVLIAAWLSRERLGRGVIAALLIFVGTLFPALGFINTYPMRYSFVADHFVYESAPALIALVVAGLVMLLGRAAVPVAVLLVAVLGALTWNQAHIFAGPESLWRDTIAKNPTSWMARHNLAVCLSAWSDRDRDAGDIAEARQKLQESLELFDQVHALRPQHEKLPINRAIAERKLKLLDEPDDTGTLLDVGLLLARSARTAEAVQPLERYVTLKPDDAEAHVSLGFVYGELGRYEPAREQFQRALQLDPQSAGARQGLELVRRATNITELPRTGQ